MSPSPQHKRQVILPEVGVDGQARLAHQRVSLPAATDDDTQRAALVYAHACGMRGEGLVRAGAQLPARLVDAFRHQQSRALGLGAALALASALPCLKTDSSNPSP